MKAFICPNCGSNLTLDDTDRDFAFCQYCGTKILLSERHEDTKRIIDEAKIEELRLRSQAILFEQEERRKASNFKRKMIILWLCVVATLVLSGVLVYLFYPDKASDNFANILFYIFCSAFIILCGGLCVVVPDNNKKR